MAANSGDRGLPFQFQTSYDESMAPRLVLTRLLRNFLTIPLLIVLGFVLLAYGVDWLDNHAGPRQAWGPLRVWLGQYVGDTESAIGMLSAIAGSLITVTSITFSILLLAVQQGAAALNSQVIDHYIARASNQAWLGFFVGVSVFVLVTLVQTTHTSAPVLGVIVSALMGAASLLALVVLIRSTIDQTRPTIVIGAIRRAALAARERQALWLAVSTEPAGRAEGGEAIRAATAGRLLPPDATALSRLLQGTPTARLTVLCAIGDYLPVGTPIALLHGPVTPGLADQVAALLPIGAQRDVGTDPGASLDHLATIGWSAISTAKSDPDVGAEVLNAIEDLLREWAPVATRADDGQAVIIYHDTIPTRLLDALESLIVAAGESRQHQSLALVVAAIANTIQAWPDRWQLRIAGLTELIGRSLPDHQPTRLLTAALGNLSGVLGRIDATDAAEQLRRSQAKAWSKP